MESLGKMLPAIVFPFVQQWAERSGLTLLAQLLVDEQFRALFEKYGDEMVRRMAQDSHPPGNGNGHGRNGNDHGNGRGTALRADPLSGADPKVNDFTDWEERVWVVEAQQEAQQALFELLRSKIRPLALALGCCPECLVGVDGCPNCRGQSRVAHYPPDYTLLQTQIVDPLAERGVPLALNAAKLSSARGSTRMRKRSKPCQKK
jgi:hypothetical protein